MNRYLPIIIAGVLLNAGAQLCLKQGMRTIGHFDFVFKNIIPVGLKVSTNPYFLFGMVCYAISVVLWLLVLSRVAVSYAYPLLSIGYIVTALAERYFWGDLIGFERWAGIIVICSGVYLITRSG